MPNCSENIVTVSVSRVRNLLIPLDAETILKQVQPKVQKYDIFHHFPYYETATCWWGRIDLSRSSYPT